MQVKGVMLNGVVIPPELVAMFETVLRVPRGRIKGSVVPILYDYVRLRRARHSWRDSQAGAPVSRADSVVVTRDELESYLRLLVGE